MRDAIKKGFLLGLGAASLTKKKADKVINSLAKRGAITKKEGQILVNGFLKEAKKQRKIIENKILREAEKEIKRVKPKLKKKAKKLEAEGRKVVRKTIKRIKV